MYNLFMRCWYFVIFLIFIALVLSVLWIIQNPGHEPIITSVLTLALFFSSIMSSKLVERYIDKTLKEKENICIIVYKRIQNEKSNFEILASEREIKYTSEGHKKAVEEYSWSLLKEDIKIMQTSGFYSKLAGKILKAIDSKNAKSVIYYINKLEGKVKKYCSSV